MTHKNKTKKNLIKNKTITEEKCVFKNSWHGKKMVTKLQVSANNTVLTNPNLFESGKNENEEISDVYKMVSSPPTKIYGIR